MAENRDFLDDLIDIQEDWKAVRSPLAGIANSLAAKPEEIPVWNPADYKERPRANTVTCISCKSNDPSTCDRCVKVCPVKAIELDETQIDIADTCRKCGLCVSVCPDESYVTREIGAKKLYNRIAGAAAAHEQAYVTCTRALGRLPKDNEIVLPCVGVVPTEVWFSVMVEYGNVSVYLPLGICDRCRTTTGEETYADLIGRAEEWAGFGLNLEVEEGDLTHDIKRSWQRQQFLEGVAKSAQNVLTKRNPVVTAAKRVKGILDNHRKQVDALQRTLDKAVGTTNSKRKRRVLSERRKLMMATLQTHPELASNIDLYMPVCDPTLCTQCGKCETVCPTHTVELTEDGRWACEEAYCIQCGACARVCPTGAIEYEFCDAGDLVLPMEEEKDRKEKEAEQKAEVERLKKEGKEKMMKGLDMIEAFSEKLDTSDSDAD
jgi:ferredoxin